MIYKKFLALFFIFYMIFALNDFSYEISASSNNTVLTNHVTNEIEVQVYAEAVVYMIDLKLKQSKLGEYTYDTEVLNQDYVKCFNSNFLNDFLKINSTQIFMTELFSDEEIQLLEYERNKIAHQNLTQEELKLLEEYKNYCDEFHSILAYNDEIFSKIVERSGGTIEGWKEMKLHTPVGYEKAVFGDEDYGHLFKLNYVEMSPELQNFRSEYRDVYPFNYEVNLSWEYPFKTSQYDADLYGFYYPNVTEEFHINSSKYNTDYLLPNSKNLISYTVYNDCIEVIFNAFEVNENTMSALAYIKDGKITDIITFIGK